MLRSVFHETEDGEELRGRMVAMPCRIGGDGGSFMRRRYKRSSLLASISASSSRPYRRSNIQTVKSHISTSSGTDTESEFEEEQPG